MLITLLISLLIILFLPILINPIRLGLWIISLAILTALNLSFIIRSWFGFILFLIYIGGLLVIFAYFVAIDPNKKLKVFDPIFIPLLITTLFIYNSCSCWALPTTLFSSITLSNYFLLLTLEFVPALIVIAGGLLIILIAAVKITNRSQGALRPFK